MMAEQQDYSIRCERAIGAMERWGLEVRLNHDGWCILQKSYTERAGAAIYPNGDHRYEEPLPAIEAAVEWLERERLLLIVEPLNRLRFNEGASVLIPCDNRKVFGPQNSIKVIDEWTGWKSQEFTGNTLAEALAAAESAKKEQEAN